AHTHTHPPDPQHTQNSLPPPNLQRNKQTKTPLFPRPLPIADLRVSSIASSALRSMHPIGVRQHVPAHQSKYDEHNHSGHDPHHTHFGFFIVSFILVRHLFLLNLSSTVTPQHHCRNLVISAYVSLTVEIASGDTVQLVGARRIAI